MISNYDSNLDKNSGNSRNSIAVDSSGNVHISYSSHYFILKYATNASGAWVTTTVDTTSDSAGDVGGIAIDASGNAHISYSDDDNGYLKYATATVATTTSSSTTTTSLTITTTDAGTTTSTTTTTTSSTTTTTVQCGKRKPAITKLSKAKGIPGDVIMITGKNFCSGGGHVFFGTMEAEYSGWSNTSITAKVPAIAVVKKWKSAAVKVKAGNGKSSNARPFKVLPQ